MRLGAFQLHKVKRAVDLYGVQIRVTRESLDEYREPNGESITFNIRGVFHETSGYISKQSNDAATLRKKSSPMLLSLWEEVKDLLHTDKVEFNNKTYTIGEIKNLGECNLIAEISLEEVQSSV